MTFLMFFIVGEPQVSKAVESPAATSTIMGLVVKAKSANEHVVTLTGNFNNPSQTAITNATITLATTGPIYTRSELGYILENSHAVNGTMQPTVKAVLGDVPAGKTRTWKLRFIGETVLGTSASGVYAFGTIATSDQVTTSSYVTTPWFYGNAQLKPTKVALAIPLTVPNRHIAAKPSSNIAQDKVELRRLSELVATTSRDSISWMIDPALKQWLKDLAPTELGPAASQLSRRLATLAGHSDLTPFGHANLAGLANSNQGAEVSSLMHYGNSIWPGHRTLYASPSGTLSTPTMDQLVLNNVTPAVSNTFLLGNARITTQAHGNLDGHDVVIFDDAASGCMTKQVNSESSFAQALCLASEIGMMTAESPAVSRTVAVLAPTQWSISQEHLDELLSRLRGNQWVSLISMSKVLTSTPQTQVNIPATAAQKPMSPRRLRAAKSLRTKAEAIGSMVTDAKWAATLSPAHYFAYSDLWATTEQATTYLNQQTLSLEAIPNAVKIQTSSRITIATTEAEIPITIANSSTHDVRIRVMLTSDTPSKFTSKPSQLVRVPVSKRVTVSVPVSLAGTGVINARVELLAPNGGSIGSHYDVRISSTAYQKVASTLVKLAFGILMLLAVSNFIRRRKSGKVESELDS